METGENNSNSYVSLLDMIRPSFLYNKVNVLRIVFISIRLLNFPNALYGCYQVCKRRRS